jgi:RNA polymerase sigma-70 factor (ECF subfamily)
VPDPEDHYAELRRELERAAAAICRGRLVGWRRDLVQTAMLKVLEIEKRREGNQPFPASYLWKVAYTALIDEVRRRRRRKEESLTEDAEAVASVRPDPERVVAGHDVQAAVRHCLVDLARPRRLAVVLYLQGYSVREAAGVLGWERKRVENLVYRGLDDLRRCLRAKGIEP